MSNIVMISVGSSYPVVGRVVEEDEFTLILEYPVAIFKDKPHVYTTQYMPFAESGLVSFYKRNIISIANVQPTIESYYKKSVNYYKNIKPIDYEMNNDDEEEEQQQQDEETLDAVQLLMAKLTNTVH